MHNRIKQIREHYHLTQEQFADAIGRNVNTVISYENQRRIPPAPVVRHICTIFGVNQSWLILGKGTMLITDDPEHELDYRQAFQAQAAQIAAQGDPLLQELTLFLWSLDEEELKMLKHLMGKWMEKMK